MFRVKFILTVFAFLFYSFFSYGNSLRSVLIAIENEDVDLAQMLARQMSADERLKLEIIFHLMEGRKKKAKKLMKRLKGDRKFLFNTLYRENGKNIIVVSKSNQELKIVEFFFDFPIVKNIYHITTGERAGDKKYKGDRRTPNGIYYPISFRTNLPSVYGSGAFPLNYPNILDKYLFKKTGGGIWIHSSDRYRRISKFSTKGCVVTTDPDFWQIRSFINLKNTPVIITEDLEFVDRETYESYRNRLLSFYDKWKRNLKDALEGREFSFFLLYSPEFVSKEGNKYSYLRKFIDNLREAYDPKISLRDLTILKYGRIPFFGDIFVISFIFDFSSLDKNYKVRKILYLKEEGDDFKIIGEENIEMD